MKRVLCVVSLLFLTAEEKKKISSNKSSGVEKPSGIACVLPLWGAVSLTLWQITAEISFTTCLKVQLFAPVAVPHTWDSPNKNLHGYILYNGLL